MKARRKKAGLIYAVLLLLVGLGLASAYHFTNPIEVANDRLQVVAGENVWGNVIGQIGGDKVQVTSIIHDPSADPHIYQSDAHDTLAVAQANLVIVNGLGYDDFLNKLISSSPHPQRTVLTVAKALQLDGDYANPHIWYDLPRIPEVATVFEQNLAAKDPADKAVFAANLKKFKTSLQPLLNTIAQTKTTYAGTPVAYTERVPGWLLGDLGLPVVTPSSYASAIEAGNDPSVADQTAMLHLIQTHQIAALLYNAQATSPTTEKLRQAALAAKIPVVGMTETIPSRFKTYQAWQQDQLNSLINALVKSRNQ